MTGASVTPGDENVTSRNRECWRNVGSQSCRRARFQAGFADEDKPARRQACRQDWRPHGASTTYAYFRKNTGMNARATKVFRALVQPSLYARWVDFALEYCDGER